MAVELLSHFSALPISLRMAINESNFPCIFKVHERTTTKDTTHKSPKLNRYQLPKNAVIKIEKETNLQLVQVRVKHGKENTAQRSAVYIPVGYSGSLIHPASKPTRKSFDRVAEIGDAIPLCVTVECDLTTTMMTGRILELTRGTKLWPLNIVKDNSDEQFLSCFTGEKTVSLPFNCAGKFVAASVYLRDLENGRLPRTVQMENKVQSSDILSESENEATFLLDSGTTPIEVMSFKKISVYVGLVTQLDTLNDKHLIVIPDDFHQLDLEQVNLLTSSNPIILKEINDYFFSWTVGIDLECIHEKLFCVEDDPCFIYLKYFSQNEDYVDLKEVQVISAGSNQSLQKGPCTPMYANDQLFQTKSKENEVAEGTGNADNASPVPDLPPRKPRKSESTKVTGVSCKVTDPIPADNNDFRKQKPLHLQVISQQMVSIPTKKESHKMVATQGSTSPIKNMNMCIPLRPKSDSDFDDYLTPVSSERRPSVNRSDSLVAEASNISLTLWQLSNGSRSRHETIEENVVGSVDVSKDDTTFFDYSVEDVSACLRQCGLDKVGKICHTEKLDGIFFKELKPEDFAAEPFCLSPFEIKKLLAIVVQGWRPK